MDMAEFCVAFARLKGVTCEEAVRQLTAMVSVVMFNELGDGEVELSDTYKRLEAFVEKEGGDIEAVARIAMSFGSHIFGSGLFDRLMDVADQEGIPGAEFPAKIVAEYLKAEKK